MKTNFALFLAALAGTGTVMAERFVQKKLDLAARERQELRQASSSLSTATIS